MSATDDSSRKFVIETQRHDGDRFVWSREMGRYASREAAKSGIDRRFPTHAWESWHIFDVRAVSL